MDFIYEDDVLTVSIVNAIHTGDIQSLKRLLVANPGYGYGANYRKRQ